MHSAIFATQSVFIGPTTRWSQLAGCPPWSRSI